MGIEVLFKGTNFLRLLQGLWISVEISLISVAISILLGLFVGVLMTLNKLWLKAILKIYLEIVRIMPQMVASVNLKKSFIRMFKLELFSVAKIMKFFDLYS